MPFCRRTWENRFEDQRERYQLRLALATEPATAGDFEELIFPPPLPPLSPPDTRAAEKEN